MELDYFSFVFSCKNHNKSHDDDYIPNLYIKSETASKQSGINAPRAQGPPKKIIINAK